MNSLKDNVISDLNQHNFAYLPGNTSSTLNDQIIGDEPHVSVILYNKQALINGFKKDMKYLMYGTSRLCKTTRDNINEIQNIVHNPVTIAISVICSLLYEYQKSYVVYEGFILHNGKLILNNNKADNICNVNNDNRILYHPKDFNDLIFINDTNDVIDNLINKATITGNTFNGDATIYNDNGNSYVVMYDDNDKPYGPSINDVNTMMNYEIFHGIVLHFFNKNITTENNLYKFKNELSWLSSCKGLNSIYSKLRIKEFSKSEAKQIINQVIYLLIVKMALFKFIDHKPISFHHVPTIKLNSGIIRNKSSKVRLQAVNKNKFIKQLIKASNPHMVYCSKDPVRSNIRNINIKIGPIKDTVKIPKDYTMNGNRGLDTNKKVINLGNNSMLYALLTDSDGITHDNSWGTPHIKVIFSNHANASQDITHTNHLYVFNEYKLNSHFYMTFIEPVIKNGEDIGNLSIVVPNLINYMYPNGVILKNYRLNIDRIIKYGKGQIVNNTNYFLLSTSKGTFNHFGPTNIRVYKICVKSIASKTINRIKKLEQNQKYVNDIERND